MFRGEGFQARPSPVGHDYCYVQFCYCGRSEPGEVHQLSGASLKRLLRVPTGVPELGTNGIHDVFFVADSQSRLRAVVVRVPVLLQFVPDGLVVLDHSQRLQELQHPKKKKKERSLMTLNRTWHCFFFHSNLVSYKKKKI